MACVPGFDCREICPGTQQSGQNATGSKEQNSDWPRFAEQLPLSRSDNQHNQTYENCKAPYGKGNKGINIAAGTNKAKLFHYRSNSPKDHCHEGEAEYLIGHYAPFYLIHRVQTGFESTRTMKTLQLFRLRAQAQTLYHVPFIVQAKLDGIVKSPSAVLRCMLRHCSVLLCTLHSSAFARLAYGAFYFAIS